MIDVDVVIAGAGAAGLSLAVRLAAQPSLSVQVLDPRSGPSDDRTFCFFRARRHPFEAAIARRFETVVVRDGTREVRARLVRHPYEELPGLAFAELALAKLAGTRAQVAWETRARSFAERADDVIVDTSSGALRTRLFVDARGGRVHAHADASRDDVRWLQHFVGHVVRTERPIFEPGVATLMDFEVSQADGPHFVYVLPSTRDEALVEDTYFSPTPWPTERYEHGLEGWLARRGAGAHTVLRRESGVIPMVSAPQSGVRRTRLVVIGQRGGAAKASSGYAFQFIQRQCDALADVLVRDGLDAPPAWIPPRSHVATFLDRVMLSFLRRHPQRAPEVFVGLFERAPADTIARFLSEEGSAVDHARVMSAVPRAAVLAEAARTWPLWLRGR